jgi:hypothetical protein
MAEEIVPQPFGDRVGHVLAVFHSCVLRARKPTILQTLIRDRTRFVRAEQSLATVHTAKKVVRPRTLRIIDGMIRSKRCPGGLLSANAYVSSRLWVPKSFNVNLERMQLRRHPAPVEKFRRY